VNQPRAIQEPDEVKLRVDNIHRMTCFYRNAFGFALIGEFPNAALLEIAENGGGRSRAIGLFKHPVHAGPEHAAVNRIRFSISLKDCGSERRRLEKLGLRVDAKDPGRISVRDPEGNQVELICHNEINA
jgi:catechol 2,3-dioxygenase-like lactoylglutathione lyase family enzyme